MTSRNDKPFTIEISSRQGGGSADYATQEQAYTEARRIQRAAEKGNPVTFTDQAGNTADHQVLGVRIFRWNPYAGWRIAHARHWSLNSPHPDALKPLPDEWYRERLPRDWRSSAKTA
jgi:hypothetical protein